MSQLIKTIKLRAYIFTCSYRTVWDNYMHEDEKLGLDFEDIIIYINQDSFAVKG